MMLNIRKIYFSFPNAENADFFPKRLTFFFAHLHSTGFLPPHAMAGRTSNRAPAKTSQSKVEYFETELAKLQPGGSQRSVERRRSGIIKLYQEFFQIDAAKLEGRVHDLQDTFHALMEGLEIDRGKIDLNNKPVVLLDDFDDEEEIARRERTFQEIADEIERK